MNNTIWTREDLPHWDAIRDADDMRGNGLRSTVIDIALDSVVEHLNEHHPKSEDVRRVEAQRNTQKTNARRARRARDKWRAAAETATANANMWMDQAATERSLAESHSESSDIWKARAEDAERERDEWKSQVDQWKRHLENGDPIRVQIRDSDIDAVNVERDRAGAWIADGEFVAADTADDADALAEEYLEKAVRRFAVANAIRHGHGPDLVEQLARALATAAYPEWNWDELASRSQQEPVLRLAASILDQEPS